MTRPTRDASVEFASPPIANAPTGPSQAEIDAAHGSTGWNAFDVWRTRIFAAQVEAVDEPAGNS